MIERHGRGREIQRQKVRERNRVGEIQGERLIEMRRKEKRRGDGDRM